MNLRRDGDVKFLREAVSVVLAGQQGWIGTLSSYYRARAGYALAILTAISFFNYLDRMVVAVLVEPIKRDLHLSDTQMGLVAGFAFAMLYAALGLPLARVADKYSRVRLLSICVGVWSLMTMLTGSVRGFAQLFAVRMAVGIGEAGCVPASHSLIGDLYPGERRAFAISMFQAGGGLGLSVGLAAAGVIADHWGWRSALASVGLAGLPLAVLAITTLREPPRMTDDAVPPSGESIVAAVKALIARPALVHLIMAISIGAFVIYGIAQWVPAFFVRAHHLSLTQVGAIGGLSGSIASVTGVLTGGAAMIRLGGRDRRWELWWPMLGYGLSGPLYLLVFLSGSWVTAFAFQFVATFSASAGVGVALSAVQNFAEPHRRATAVALVLALSSFLGLGIGPVGIGLVSDWLAPHAGVDSLRYALMGSTILMLWSGLHFWLAARAGTGELRAAGGATA